MPTEETRRRAGVLLCVDGTIALIRRERDGHCYYLVPGGGVEPGESDVDAAVREAREELGLEVECSSLLAEVTFNGKTQAYFLAHVVGGTFGTGNGEEMASSATSTRGSYTPVWVSFDDLQTIDARPMELLRLVATGDVADEPLRILER